MTRLRAVILAQLCVASKEPVSGKSERPESFMSHRDSSSLMNAFLSDCPPPIIHPPKLNWTLIRTSLFLTLSSLAPLLTTSERLFGLRGRANLVSVSPQLSETLNRRLASDFILGLLRTSRAATASPTLGLSL